MPIEDYSVDYRDDKASVVRQSGVMRQRIPTFSEQELKPEFNVKKLRIFLSVAFLSIALVIVVFFSMKHNGKFDLDAIDLDGDQAYNDFILPVVMQDPDVFESIQDADTEMLISASVWRAIMLNKVTVSDTGFGIIPEEEVRQSFMDLFGQEYIPVIDSSLNGNFFEVDETSHSFVIKPYSNQGSYTPYIDSVEKKGAEVRLRVGYVSPNDDWRSLKADKPDTPTPSKYAYYILKKDSTTNSLMLSSIQNE